MQSFLRLLFQWMRQVVSLITGSLRILTVSDFSIARWHHLLAQPILTRERGYLAVVALAFWLGSSGTSWGQTISDVKITTSASQSACVNKSQLVTFVTSNFPAGTTSFVVTLSDGTGSFASGTALTASPSSFVVGPASQTLTTILTIPTGTPQATGYKLEVSATGATSGTSAAFGVYTGPPTPIPATSADFTINSKFACGLPASLTLVAAAAVNTYQLINNVGTTIESKPGSLTIIFSPVSTTGTYRVLVNNANCSALIDQVNGVALVSNSSPASITAQPISQTTCSGTPASFSVGGTPSGVTYQWWYRNNSTWTSLPNSASVAGATTATLSLTPGGTINTSGRQLYVVVSNTICSPSSVTSNIVTFTFNTSPTVSVVPSNTFVCQNTPVSFTALVSTTAVGPNTYTWSSGESVSVVTNSGGTTGVFPYSVAITDANGCTANSATRSLTVNAGPSASPNAIISNPGAAATGGNVFTVCEGSSITLTSSCDSGIPIWVRIVSGLPSTTLAITTSVGIGFAGSAAGTSRTYTVGCTSPGCPPGGTTSFTVTSFQPTAPTIARSSTAVCSGATVVLSASVTGGVGAPFSYTWSAGTTSGGVSNSITTITTGATGVQTYSVTNISNRGCTNTASATVLVNELPMLSTFFGTDPVCVGQPMTFSAPVGGLTIPTVTPSYSFTIEQYGTGCTGCNTTVVSGYTSPIVNATLIANSVSAAPGFRLKVSTTVGCTASVTRTTIVNSPPSISSGTFAATAPSPCFGSPATFTATITGFTGSYNYTLTNGTSASVAASSGNGTFSQAVTPTTSGSTEYSLIVSSTAGCTATIATATVTVTPTSVTNVNTSEQFCTIQSAIDDSDTQNSHTILVGVGTFSEEITINKELTLLGAKAGAAGYGAGRGTGESIIDGGGTRAGIKISANNVIVNGFTVQGFQNNVFNAAFYFNGNPLTGVQILNNIIRDNPVGVLEPHANTKIKFNLFDGNNRNVGGAPGAGIFAETYASNGMVIEANIFRNHTLNSPVVISGVAGNHQSLTFTQNTIESSNTALGSMVYVMGVTNGVFSQNTLNGSGIRSLKLAGGNTNISVTNNFITFSSSTTGVALTNDGQGNNLNVSINNNSFSGNTGFAIDNRTGVTANATCNWFGTTSNVDTFINGPVTFAPYLTDGNDNAPATVGFQPAPNSCNGCLNGVLVTNLNTGVNYCTIQDAIFAASTLDSHTISVGAGTYPESVTITKQLTLRGAKFGQAGNAGGRGTGETIITAPTNNTTSGQLFIVNATDVTIDGFTFNGDNTAIGSGLTANGADVNAAYGISNLTSGLPFDADRVRVQNNVFQNLASAGVLLTGGIASFGPLVDGLVANNAFTNVRGAAIFNAYNVYCSVTNNVIGANCVIGLSLSNYTAANSGTPSVISGNDVTSEQAGIFYNLVAGSGSTITISGNTMRTSTGATANIGMTLFAQKTASATVTNNTVTAGATYGVLAWNNTNGVDIIGGNVTGATIAGVAQTNYADFFGGTPTNNSGDNLNGTVQSMTVSGVSISGSPAGVLVLDDPANINVNITAATIRNNTNISTPTNGTAVAIRGGQAIATIVGNPASFTSGDGTGIGIDVNGGTAVVGTSRITNFATGIQVSNGGYLAGVTNSSIINNTSAGVTYAANANAMQGVVNNNDLSGNPAGNAINSSIPSPTTINAECNWYGSVQNVPLFITGNVDFTPYLKDGTDASAAAGFQPTADACTPQSPTLTLSSSTLCAGAPFSLTVTGCSAYDIYVTGANIGGAGINSATVTANATGTAVFNSLTAGMGTQVYSASCVEPNDVAPVSSTAGSATITVNANPTVALTPLSQTVCAGNSVTLTSTATGGNGIYTYTYNPTAANSNTIVVPTITAQGGTTLVYSVTVTDGNSCTAVSPASASIAVNVQPAINSFTTNATTQPFCTSNVRSSLTLSATVTPATAYTILGPAAYSVNGTSNAISGTLAQTLSLSSTTQSGSYTLIVRSGNCQSTSVVSVTVAQAPDFAPTTAFLPTSISYCASAPVAFTVLMSGGTPTSMTYTFSSTLTSGATSTTLPATDVIGTQQAIFTAPVANSFTNGIYTQVFRVFATDQNGCISRTNDTPSSATVAEETVLTAALSQNVACFGNATGAIALTALGGTAPYSLTLSPGSSVSVIASGSTGSFTGLTAGAYSVSVTNSRGCRAVSNSVMINGPTAALAFSNTAVTAVRCFGGNTGTISLSVSGGTASYTLTASPGSASAVLASAGTASLTGLAQGTYTITITDANGCGTVTGGISVTQPTVALGFNAPTATSVACSGGSTGSLTVSATGGTAGYSYSLTPGTSATNSIGEFTSLPAGSYTVIITDVNGCRTATDGITIAEPAAITLSISPSGTIVCAGTDASLTALASGGASGYSYVWSSGTNPANSSTSVVAATTTIADAGTIKSYTVTVTDANGCTASAAVSVTVSALVSATLTPAPSATLTCNLRTITLTATPSGQATYAFRGLGLAQTSSVNTATVNQADTFTVLVTDVNGCTALATTEISSNTTVPANATLTVNGSGTLTCSVQTLTLTAATTSTGSFTYAFNSPAMQIGTSSSAIVSAGGNYSVLITGANGCTNTAAVTVFQNSTAPQVSLVPSGVITCSNNNATLTATATSAGSSYTYVLSNGQRNTIGVFPVVGTGPFTVTATAANGCSNTATTTVSSNVDPPSAALFQSGTITCANLSVTAQVIGNGVQFQRLTSTTTVDGFVITSTETNTNGSFIINQPGPFSITAIGSNGCKTVVNGFAPSNTSAVSASLIASGTITCGTLSATLTASGGSSYTLAGPTGTRTTSTTGVFVVNAAGPYTVTVTNASGCTGTASTTVQSNIATPTAGLVASGTITCSNTSATLTASGGTSYTLLNGGGLAPSGGVSTPGQSNTSGVFTVSQGGAYTVLVAGPNGCTASATTTVQNNIATPTAGLIASGTITCSNASATLTASGGVTYSLNGSTNSTGVFIVSTAGIYSVIVTGANGCTASASATVTNDASIPQASLIASGTITCTNASATLTASGGGTYTFNGQSGTANVFTVNAPGTYSVVVTSANGCSAVATATVQSNTDTPTAGLLASGTITCSNASATLTASGGVSYAFNGQTNTTGIFTVNAPGTYSVVVTGANGCTASTSATVTSDTSIPTAGLVASGTITCTNTSVTLTASGGVSYAVNGQSNTTGVFLVNAPGTYTVVVTSTNGCSATASATVTGSTSAPIAGLVASGTITCTNPSATLTASGGVTYSLNGSTNSTGVFIVSTAGIYSVIVTGANGCTASASATVTNDASIPQASLIASGTITCTNASATLTASGGGIYAFNGQSGTANVYMVNAPGTYSVVVTGANGCSAIATATVQSNTDTPTAGLLASGTITCSNLSATLTASGGVSYGFNGQTNQTGVFTVTTSGTYSIIVMGTNGCTATASATVTSDASVPTAGLVTSGTITCANGSATLTASGGVSYALNGQTNSTGVFIVSTAGIYSVIVTGANGCTASASATVTNDASIPQASLIASGTITCTNASATLTASGGGIYAFNGQSGTANVYMVNAPGTYSVVVTGANGCSAVATATVTGSTSAPTASVVASGTITCSNASVTLTASGGVSYAFNGQTNTTGIFTVNAPGIYSVTVTGTNGCIASASATVTGNTNLPVAVGYGTMITCYQPISIISVGIGVNYSLNGQTNTTGSFTVNAPGTYNIVVTGANGCTAVAGITVPGSTSAPQGSLVASGTITCSSTSATLTASGGVSYSFNGQTNQTGIFLVNATGTYSVVVTSANGCTATASATVTGDASVPQASLVASGVITCASPSATLTASGGVSYALNGQSNTTGVFVVNAAGTYSVIVTGGNGCTASASTAVTSDQTVPTLTLFGNSTVCQGQSIQLMAMGNGSFRWNTGETTAVISVSATNTYSVTLTGVNGCTVATSQLVTAVSCSTTTPIPTGCGSPTSTLGQALVVTGVTDVNCMAGSFRILTTGGTGQAIDYTPITGMRNDDPTNCIRVVDSGALLAAINNPISDIGPFAVRVMQNGAMSNTFAFDFKGACTSTTPPSSTTSTPTNPTPTGCGSATSTLGQPLVVTGFDNVNCTTGAFRILTSGGNGQPINFAGIVGLSNMDPYNCMRMVDNPNLAADLRDQNSSVGPFSLKGMQVGNGESSTFVFDFKGYCASTTPPSATTSTPPSSTTASPTPAGCGSPTVTLGQPLVISGVADANCATGTFRILTTGGNGQPINFAGIVGMSNTDPYNCVRRLDNQDLITAVNSQTSSVQPFELKGMQVAGATTPPFAFNFKQFCTGSARVAKTETVGELEVTVLGNPTLGETVEVIIRNAGNQLVELRVSDALGGAVSQQHSTIIANEVRQQVRLGKSAGIYLLQVTTPTRTKTVKIVRQ